jgi:hypothetical protein
VLLLLKLLHYRCCLWRRLPWWQPPGTHRRQFTFAIVAAVAANGCAAGVADAGAASFAAAAAGRDACGACASSVAIAAAFASRHERLLC